MEVTQPERVPAHRMLDCHPFPSSGVDILPTTKETVYQAGGSYSRSDGLRTPRVSAYCFSAPTEHGGGEPTDGAGDRIQGTRIPTIRKSANPWTTLPFPCCPCFATPAGTPGETFSPCCRSWASTFWLPFYWASGMRSLFPGMNLAADS